MRHLPQLHSLAAGQPSGRDSEESSGLASRRIVLVLHSVSSDGLSQPGGAANAEVLTPSLAPASLAAPRPPAAPRPSPCGTHFPVLLTPALAALAPCVHKPGQAGSYRRTGSGPGSPCGLAPNAASDTQCARPQDLCLGPPDVLRWVPATLPGLTSASGCQGGVTVLALVVSRPGPLRPSGCDTRGKHAATKEQGVFQAPDPGTITGSRSQ